MAGLILGRIGVGFSQKKPKKGLNFETICLYECIETGLYNYFESEMVETIGLIVIKQEKKMLVYKEAEFFLREKICLPIWPIILKRVGNTANTLCLCTWKFFFEGLGFYLIIL